MFLYRYEDSFHHGTSLYLYRVVRETPCYWIVRQYYQQGVTGPERRVLKAAKCPYGHPSISEAKDAYIRRKEAQLRHLLRKVAETQLRLHGMQKARKSKPLPHKRIGLAELAGWGVAS